MPARARGGRLRTAAAALAVLLLGAACGGSSESDLAEEASARPATTEVTSPSTPAPTSPAPTSRTADGWVRHDDPSGVSLEHPADWEVRPGTAGPLFLFLDPESGVPFRRNINVMLQAAGPSMTLEEYSRLSIDQLEDIEGASRSELRSLRISGTPGQRIEYIADLGSGNLRFLGAWTMRDGKAWLFTYTSDPDRFEDGLPDVERVLRTMRLPE
jgi:hypothetical protein